MVQIKAKKDLYNRGKCFTKGKIYKVFTGKNIVNTFSLMECSTYNDLNEYHIIGSFHKYFEIINN